jgi:hypothetical protein
VNYMRLSTIILTATMAAAPVTQAQRPQTGVERTTGIAFQSGTDRFTIAVECAARRGRVDILATDFASPVLWNGLYLAPLSGRGDYYLFDSTSFILVRPASKTFAIFSIADATYNFNDRRDGWPDMFDFTTIRPQPVSPAEAVRRQAERHGAFQIYWHVDVDWDRPTFQVLSRGRLGVSDAPPGESTVARWFGPALALAELASIDSAGFLARRIGLTAVAPLVGENGSRNLLSKQWLEQLRMVSVDPDKLTLPRDYTAVAIAGSLTENQARTWITSWHARPLPR